MHHLDSCMNYSPTYSYHYWSTMSTDTVKGAGLTTVCTPPSFIATCKQSMIHMQIKLRILITNIYYYEHILNDNLV